MLLPSHTPITLGCCSHPAAFTARPCPAACTSLTTTPPGEGFATSPGMSRVGGLATKSETNKTSVATGRGENSGLELAKQLNTSLRVRMGLRGSPGAGLSRTRRSDAQLRSWASGALSRAWASSSGSRAGGKGASVLPSRIFQVKHTIEVSEQHLNNYNSWDIYLEDMASASRPNSVTRHENPP